MPLSVPASMVPRDRRLKRFVAADRRREEVQRRAQICREEQLLRATTRVHNEQQTIEAAQHAKQRRHALVLERHSAKATSAAEHVQVARAHEFERREYLHGVATAKEELAAYRRRAMIEARRLQLGEHVAQRLESAADHRRVVQAQLQLRREAHADPAALQQAGHRRELSRSVSAMQAAHVREQRLAAAAVKRQALEEQRLRYEETRQEELDARRRVALLRRIDEEFE